MAWWWFWTVLQVPGNNSVTISWPECVSSKGVEAQTLTVWRQADRFSLPRIVYVNKMDRKDGDVYMCCASIEKKLDVPAVLLQLPAVKNGKLFGRYYLFYTWKIKLNWDYVTKLSGLDGIRWKNRSIYDFVWQQTHKWHIIYHDVLTY